MDLPADGATFRIDSIQQLARAAGRRFVCSLPFCVTGNKSLLFRVKFWFNEEKELQGCLLVSKNSSFWNPYKDTVTFKPCISVVTSGQIFCPGRGMFFDLWNTQINQYKHNAVHKEIYSPDQITVEDVFPLQLSSIKLSEGVESDLPHGDKSADQTRQAASGSSVTLNNLTSNGFMFDNTVMMKWDVKLL